MIAYGIGFLTHIRELREAHPRVTQMWYADEAGAGGTFHHIMAHLRDMQARSLPRGYFLEPIKSISAMALRNVARTEDFFQWMGLHIVMGSRYLGGFIGYGEAEKIWLAGKVEI